MVMVLCVVWCGVYFFDASYLFCSVFNNDDFIFGLLFDFNLLLYCLFLSFGNK